MVDDVDAVVRAEPLQPIQDLAPVRVVGLLKVELRDVNLLDLGGARQVLDREVARLEVVEALRDALPLDLRHRHRFDHKLVELPGTDLEHRVLDDALVHLSELAQEFLEAAPLEEAVRVGDPHADGPPILLGDVLAGVSVNLRHLEHDQLRGHHRVGPHPRVQHKAPLAGPKRLDDLLVLHEVNLSPRLAGVEVVFYQREPKIEQIEHDGGQPRPERHHLPPVERIDRPVHALRQEAERLVQKVHREDEQEAEDPEERREEAEHPTLNVDDADGLSVLVLLPDPPERVLVTAPLLGDSNHRIHGGRVGGCRRAFSECRAAGRRGPSVGRRMKLSDFHLSLHVSSRKNGRSCYRPRAADRGTVPPPVFPPPLGPYGLIGRQERSVRGRLMCSNDDAGSTVAPLSDSSGRRWTRLPKTRSRTFRFEHASLSSGRKIMRPCSSRRYPWGSAFWRGPRREAPRPTCSSRAFCLRWRPWAGTGRTWRGGTPPLIFRPDGRRAIRHHRGDVSRMRSRVPRPGDAETPEHVPFRPRGPRTFEHGSTQDGAHAAETGPWRVRRALRTSPLSLSNRSTATCPTPLTPSTTSGSSGPPSTKLPRPRTPAIRLLAPCWWARAGRSWTAPAIRRGARATAPNTPRPTSSASPPANTRRSGSKTPPSTRAQSRARCAPGRSFGPALGTSCLGCAPSASTT